MISLSTTRARNRSLRVALVDEQTPRPSLARQLADARDYEWVGCFGTSRLEIEQMAALDPGLVLVGNHLVAASSLGWIRRIRVLLPRTPVLLLVAEDVEAGLLDQQKQIVDRSIEIGAGIIEPGLEGKIFHAINGRSSSRGGYLGVGPDKNDILLLLSKREHEVMALLVGGAQYKDIANELGVSYSTVHTHLRHIYRKLEVHTATQAAVKYQKCVHHSPGLVQR